MFWAPRRLSLESFCFLSFWVEEVYWFAAKEFKLSVYNKETLLLTISLYIYRYTYYDSSLKFLQQPSLWA